MVWRDENAEEIKLLQIIHGRAADLLRVGLIVVGEADHASVIFF